MSFAPIPDREHAHFLEVVDLNLDALAASDAQHGGVEHLPDMLGKGTWFYHSRADL